MTVEFNVFPGQKRPPSTLVGESYRQLLVANQTPAFNCLLATPAYLLRRTPERGNQRPSSFARLRGNTRNRGHPDAIGALCWTRTPNRANTPQQRRDLGSTNPIPPPSSQKRQKQRPKGQEQQWDQSLSSRSPPYCTKKQM